jgi:hypothetical protein
MMSDKLLQSHNTHHNLNLRRLEKSHHSPFYNIFCNSLWGYIKFFFFFWDSKVRVPKLSNYESHQFGSSQIFQFQFKNSQRKYYNLKIKNNFNDISSSSIRIDLTPLLCNCMVGIHYKLSFTQRVKSS